MPSVRELPADYDERVYAGVLGKIIGVYLGRPFEGWTYDRILRDLGEITGYVNDRVDLPLNNHLLVVTDDDISGTLVFPRVLARRADRGATGSACGGPDLVERAHPRADGPLVGRLRELDGAHRVPASAGRGRGSPVGLSRAERPGGLRAGRCTDLLRGVRDDLSRGSGPGGGPGAGGGQRES